MSDTNTIELSSTAPTTGDTLYVNGTDNADTILVRASSDPSGKAFVAALHGDDVERVNYTSNIDDLIVDAKGGDDTVILDDNRTKTLIYGGEGNDTFQIGQVFKSPRDVASAGIAPDDVFETIQTTRGWLSNGVSFQTTIDGGDGR